jgi:hypothetical protein
MEPVDYCDTLDGPNTDARNRYRPLCGGISAAHYLVEAGTLGAIVLDAQTGGPLLLGNNHTFANMDSVYNRRAYKGDPILQPSRGDGGTYPDDVVAYLERWVPFDPICNNLIDAAVAKPAPGVLSDDLILSEGSGSEFIIPEGIKACVQSKVRKFGRTGGETVGHIIDCNYNTVIPYPSGIEVHFIDQILIQIDTCAGDSGAVYIDDNDRVIGLHCGGAIIDGTRFAVANKIENVCRLLGIII